METSDHLDLKRLAVAYLRAIGCVAVGVEVRSPISTFLFDAAGWRDSVRVPRRRNDGSWGMGHRRIDPESIVIECKQSRSDFLKDSRDRRRLVAERARLDLRRQRLEERVIKPNEPHLRAPDATLYGAEDSNDAWDFSRTRCVEHRDIVAELRRIERLLSDGTKFGDIARWALADRLYLCAPSGLVRRHEVPPGWGLIECRRSKLRRAAADPEAALAEDLVVRVEADRQPCDPDRRVRLLRNIASSTTRAWLRSDGAYADATPIDANTIQTTDPSPT
ncbi:MAG: hypothetical protein H6813_05360 [Phycisphaeraceae bacterium]|nr:hypothetical protein [Phycisphaeraceae bacterium]MCB9847812.1 hypothetical protein [Phycisphaeraceae bacterium]